MAVTSEPRFAEILRSLQNRGLDLVAPNELYARPGRNNRFSEIAAAMGLSQLRCLPEFLAARREVARTYDTLLARHSEILTPVVAEQGSLPSYWRYVVLLRHEIGRPELKKLMAAEAISIDWAYDPPMHLQPVFTRMYNTSVGMLPRTEKLLSTHICLPVHARMRVLDAEYVVERVVESVRTFLN
jgi:dTDP-4-amino-4,6-dideoxygalactose transaminase